MTALYEVRPTRSAATLGEVRLRWTVPSTGEVVERQVPIEDRVDGEPSDAVRLAAAVATTAEVLRGNADVTARGVTLATVHADAEELVADGVPGAEQLRDVIDAALAVE